MSDANISKEMELRHLPTHLQLQLVKLLDVDDSVLSLLMANVVKNLEDSNSELRFNSADIDAIREHSQRHKKSSILVLLDEWSTMGKIRPKMKHLFGLLIKCQLFQAADYVAKLINEPCPERPNNGPAAKVDISLSLEDTGEIVNNLSYPFSSIDITTRANRINNFVKPEFHTPDMNFVNHNSDENGQSNQPTASAQSRIFTQQPEKSDLIQFSKSMSSQVANGNTTSMFIPATVNSNDQEVTSNSSNSSYVPALSGLMSSSNIPQKSSEQLPIFLQSMISESPIPDFSGIMAQTDDYSNDLSSSQSQSQTDYSINTTS